MEVHVAEAPNMFADGKAYERFIGRWSQLAGEKFLDWIDPPKNLRWIDVGCGNGAFTEVLISRCSPAAVTDIDPSDGQIAYASTRPGTKLAQFRIADAQSLPFADDSFDAASMALVITFVPDPVKAPRPPGSIYSARDNMRAVWERAGLQSIDMQVIRIPVVYSRLRRFLGLDQCADRSNSQGHSRHVVRYARAIQSALARVIAHRRRWTHCLRSLRQCREGPRCVAPLRIHRIRSGSMAWRPSCCHAIGAPAFFAASADGKFLSQRMPMKR
jgi:SAM-dependent methyltransferase